MDETTSPSPSAIVVAVDRWGSGFLGPYGNTWIDTPAINQLATESVLFENAVADSNDLALLYRSYWSGVHAMCHTDRPECRLPKLLEEKGIGATLLTDDDSLLQHPLAEGFGEHVACVEPATDRRAPTIAETQFAHLTLAVIDWLTGSTEPGLLWVHARGMGGAWDAPSEVAERFRDDGDPEAYNGVTPPRFVLDHDYDPDDVLRVMHAYAAQISVLDACLGSLLDAIGRHQLAAETLVIVTSSRGYPLGEHGRIGPGESDLFGETLQVPLLVRSPRAGSPCRRVDTLVQPTDLYATLAAWFGVSEANSSTGRDLLVLSDSERAWTREAAFSVGNREQAVRTPAWLLHIDKDATNSELLLYAKPDDRWETNEVADRCGEVPEQLRKLIDNFAKLVNQGSLIKLPPLPRDLAEGIE